MKRPLSYIAHLGPLVVILALAVYVRFDNLTSSPVDGQPAQLIRLAAHFVNTGEWPLAATASPEGILYPPLVVYLLAIPLAWQSSGEAALFFQAVLSVVAVLALYFYTTRLFNHRVGLLAAFLLSINPWVVRAGQVVGYVGLVPLFSVLLWGTMGWWWRNGRQPLYWILTFVWLAALSQLGFQAISLFPVIWLIGIGGWRLASPASAPSFPDLFRSLLKPTFLGLGLFLLLYLPYLVFDRVTGYSNIRTYWMSLVPTAEQLFYLLPAFCLVIALGVDRVADWFGRFSKPIQRGGTAVLFAMVLVVGLWQIRTLINGINEENGRTVADLDALIQESRTALQPHPGCELIILGEGNHADTSPLGIMEEFVYPTPVRFIQQRRGFIIPAHCAVYLLAGSDAFAETWLGEHGERITGAFYYLAKSETAEIHPLASWRNGLELLDYQIEGEIAPGQTFTLHYTWHVTQTPRPGSHFNFFNHFLDQTGEIIAQEDGPGVDTFYWQAGDHLINHFYITLPPDLPAGNFSLLTGVYTWPELRRVRLRRSEETTYPLDTSFSLPG